MDGPIQDHVDIDLNFPIVKFCLVGENDVILSFVRVYVYVYIVSGSSLETAK